MHKILIVIIVVASVSSEVLQRHVSAADDTNGDGWVTIFDGKSFDGWQFSESPESWKIEDGALVAHGSRSHLFYTGDERPFVNFEFTADVMTRPGSNSGIYFHTRFQKGGFPRQGYECQVNNTQRDPQKTGGLYNTVKVLKAPAADNTWFTQYITVQGKHIVVKIDGKTVVDYTEPDDRRGPVRLSEGTFALQAHDPNSIVMFKNIRVKRLP